MGSGAISLLIDSPLRTVYLAFRGFDAAVRRQITRFIKRDAGLIWTEEIRERGQTRLEQRALVGTARVGVSGTSVTLIAGGRGTLSTGTPISAITDAAEYGSRPDKTWPVKSRSGKTYQRRMGGRFRPPRRGGYVAHRAAGEAIPRVAALVVQTVIRTFHELVEGAGR